LEVNGGKLSEALQYLKQLFARIIVQEISGSLDYLQKNCGYNIVGELFSRLQEIARFSNDPGAVFLQTNSL
jgi:hypothetical protein